MFLILRRYAVCCLLAIVLAGVGVVSAQRPITSSSSAAQQYGTLPGLAGQNQSQMQYGNIGGTIDNNATTGQQTDTFSMIRLVSETVLRGMSISKGTISI